MYLYRIRWYILTKHLQCTVSRHLTALQNIYYGKKYCIHNVDECRQAINYIKFVKACNACLNVDVVVHTN